MSDPNVEGVLHDTGCATYGRPLVLVCDCGAEREAKLACHRYAAGLWKAALEEAADLSPESMYGLIEERLRDEQEQIVRLEG